MQSIPKDAQIHKLCPVLFNLEIKAAGTWDFVLGYPGNMIICALFIEMGRYPPDYYYNLFIEIGRLGHYYMLNAKFYPTINATSGSLNW